jgi:hypothetical protein
VIPLEDIYTQYGNPDPATVSTINRNGVELAYVGHAEITKALSEIDPMWTWEPVLGADGLPLIRIQNGLIPRRDREPIAQDMATMWGRLTLNGVTRWAVGSVEAHKPDLDKELVSDFLRNAAMRFGVALGLWMKSPAPATLRPVPAPKQTREAPPAGASAHPVYEPAQDASDEPRATDAQERALYAISKKLDRLPPAKGTLTKRQAGQAIEQLQELLNGKTETDEEPF